MIFDYLRTTTALDTIEIEDIGNCAVNAMNDDAEEWFLIINTYEGWTETIEFGPLVVDDDDIKTYFKYDKFSSDYSEKKIGRSIDRFINDPKRMITQVFEVDKEFAKSRLNSIKDKL